MNSVTPAVAQQLQSMLWPAGTAAHTVAGISWVLFIGAGLIFVTVMALLAWALLRRVTPRPVHGKIWLWGGGVVFPVVVLVSLMFYTMQRAPGWLANAPPDALFISITAHLWWWEVRYRDPVSGQDITLANELHLPVGRPVKLGLNSADVIHSFWVPALAGKRDLVPGRVNHLQVEATQAGVYRGQCAEFCGEQHARMALHVVASPSTEFDAWLAAQARPAAAANSALLHQGQQAFMAQRCNACHAVRGVAETSRLGPDLTHVGSRLYLAAGTLPNQRGNMAHWIADTQSVKPGARMPSSPELDPATLNALASWLEHLK